MDDTWLPLFPLNTVLFPDGILPLRVFETRYMDMARACMKSASPFGVVLIKSGAEVGTAAEPEQVGTLAHIAELDMENLGVLLLRATGGKRFRILQTRVLPDQRLEGVVAMLPEGPTRAISNQHLACAQTLKLVIDDLKTRLDRGTSFDKAFPHPFHLDNAGWVANRWRELLPIPLKARQKLLELDDPQVRLATVYSYLQQHEII